MRDKLFLILRDMGFKAFTLADKADYLLANDVVPVVRCKNCKHCVIREYEIIDELECEFFDVFTHPLDYCSKGERKDNEQT